MLSNWLSYLSRKQNKLNFGFTALFLIIILIALPQFLAFIESRDGFAFSDPLLNLFKPVDVTWLTFGLIYLGLITAIVYLINKPALLLLTMKTYAVTVAARIIAMYFLPLEPPTSIILLEDPFVQFFGSGEVLTKDLFFSGHTSLMFILFLTSDLKELKLGFLLGTILVAATVLLQHVHYTIDVFAAPFFAYASFRIAQKIDYFFGQSGL